MGRGNVCTHGEHEGLYYVDWDNFLVHFYDEENDCETDEIDYEGTQVDMEVVLVHAFPNAFMKRFPSFSRCDKWIDRSERRAIMESSLFYICLQDNEWSMAVELIQKDTFDDRWPALQGRHYQTYLDGMRDCLFEFFPELGIYSGAWTSGTIRREDYEKKKEAV